MGYIDLELRKSGRVDILSASPPHRQFCLFGVASFGRIHSCCLMPNHFHLLLETREPNLVAGMEWFLGGY
ncbi:MAG: hypothetical protein C0404_04720 [Verrucomicrobia bacterium]|nr:hypothetical protein [Verrucomicrobiota bacterium]